jgi:hypothetical protein
MEVDGRGGGGDPAAAQDQGHGARAPPAGMPEYCRGKGAPKAQPPAEGVPTGPRLGPFPPFAPQGKRLGHPPACLALSTGVCRDPAP